MSGIIKFVLVVCVCLLIGLTLACGLAVLIKEVVPTLSGMDFAIIMQALAH